MRDILREHDKLYLIDNKFVKRPTNVKQSLWQEIHGTETGDTILNIKLRAQDQLGCLAEEVKIQLQVGDKVPDPKGMGKYPLYPTKPTETCADSSFQKDRVQYQIIYQPTPPVKSDSTTASSSTVEANQTFDNKIHYMLEHLDRINVIEMFSHRPSTLSTVFQNIFTR